MGGDALDGGEQVCPAGWLRAARGPWWDTGTLLLRWVGLGACSEHPTYVGDGDILVGWGHPGRLGTPSYGGTQG